MAAFSVFFMQHPSFLAFQRSSHQITGSGNTRALFAMDGIPTDHHIRQVLDGVSPQCPDNACFYLVDAPAARNPGIIHNSPGNHTLIALNGSEYFCSSNDGEREYFHAFLAATIVTSQSKTVFS